MTQATIAEAMGRAKALAPVSDSAQLDTELLLADVLDKSRSYLYTWPERQLSDAQELRFAEHFDRRLQGEPIAYILGYQDFWTLRLKVSPATLIPRPETELLVELALQMLPEVSAQVADLGTGTGAIALALASERPQWQVTAVDFSAAAVALAEANRNTLKLGNVEVLQGSWCQPLRGETLDLIVSNPPYIDQADPHLAEGDVRFEPSSALVAERQGMADIEQIASQALQCLKPGGWLMLEHGWQQGEAVRACLQENGYQQIDTLEDLVGHERVTRGQRP